MRLKQPLLNLPIHFDADVLAAEVAALPASAWLPHPTGFAGNEAVPLVTPDGKPSDAFEGAMAPTAQLLACPYMMEMMAELGGVWGRSRLMALAAGAEVPAHVDTHYYWRTHLRIHIPVVTNPGVLFTCGDQTVHMAAGECWLFDSFHWHEVHNHGAEQRIHLVLDTVGGERLWDMVEATQDAGAAAPESRLLRPGERSGEGLAFERVNAPTVMSPWEIRCHVAFLAEQTLPHSRLATVRTRIERFIDGWAAAWAQFGTADEGRATYRGLIAALRRDLDAIEGGKRIELENELSLYVVLDQLVLQMAIAPQRPVTLRAASVEVGAQR